uniref:Uncharacterized protein n=1 Tax=Plectus sambesii TaxID=2011161 RepID=A0A914WMM2_9BILA
MKWEPRRKCGRSGLGNFYRQKRRRQRAERMGRLDPRSFAEVNRVFALPLPATPQLPPLLGIQSSSHLPSIDCPAVDDRLHPYDDDAHATPCSSPSARSAPTAHAL